MCCSGRCWKRRSKNDWASALFGWTTIVERVRKEIERMWLLKVDRGTRWAWQGVKSSPWKARNGFIWIMPANAGLLLNYWRCYLTHRGGLCFFRLLCHSTIFWKGICPRRAGSSFLLVWMMIRGLALDVFGKQTVRIWIRDVMSWGRESFSFG